TVTDALPSSVTWLFAGASQGSCSGTTTVTCNLGTLASSANATVAIIATVSTASSSATNTASVTATQHDPTPGNNQASVTSTFLATNARCVSVTGVVLETLVSSSPTVVTTGSFFGGRIQGEYNFRVTSLLPTGDASIPSMR